MDTFRIDEVARRLLDNLPPAFRATQRDLESNFRAVLRSSLGKLDLVTRDEFDTQARVLERTRARLEALEARVRELEGTAGGGAAGPATSTNAPATGATAPATDATAPAAGAAGKLPGASN